MDELHSWWEVPAIAHFFSLFKSCFSLSDFTIEELEEALLTDGDDEKSTYFVSRLLMELLEGYYDNANITVTTCHDWLRRIMKERWEEIEGRINPLSSVEADFHQLPLRMKVQIIHRITEYRLDAADVESKLQGLNATDLRLEPLGSDRNGAKFWYFFGVRLYKESPAEEEKPNEKFESKKKKKKKKRKKNKFNGLGINPNSEWSVACYTVGDWKKTAHKMKGTESRRERALVQLITENFLPNLPKIVEDMEHQRLLKLQSEPRRSSCRLLARKLCEAEQEAEKKCALERAEKVRKEREERERTRGDTTTLRMKNDFEKMIRLELERKWKDDAEKKSLELLKESEAVESSSGDEDAMNGREVEQESKNDVSGTKLGKRKVKDETVKNNKKAKIMKKPEKKKNAELKKLKKKNSISSADGPKGWRRTSTSGLRKKKSGGRWGGRKGSFDSGSRDSDDDDDGSSENDEVDQIAMQKVMSEVQNHPEAWQFESPVDETIAPGYHSIIKRPMDLSEIERKIGSGEYESPQDFVADMTLMFNNCRLYNGPESEYTEVADEIDELFRNLVKKHLPHVPIDDVIYKAVYPDPQTKTREVPMAATNSDSSDEEVEHSSGGATTRAAWKSNIQRSSDSTSRQSSDAKSRGRGRGRGKGRGRGRGRGREQTAMGRPPKGRPRGRGGRGRRLSKRLSSQRERKLSEKISHESGSEENDEASDEHENETISDEEEEREKVTENVSSPNKSKPEVEKPTTRRSSSSSSRNSSTERNSKKEENETETKAKPQNVWSLDFLASQARVLEEQQQQQRPSREDKPLESPATPVEKEKPKISLSKTLDDVIIDDEKLEQKVEKKLQKSPSKLDNSTEDDVYSFKDDEEESTPPKIENRLKLAGRESVISSTGALSPPQTYPLTPAPSNFPMTPAPVYPMTPGYPDPPRFQSPTRAPKRHSVDSGSPPTPSSGYGSYNPTGRSSTPSEGVPAFNPPTPRMDPSPEKSSAEKLNSRSATRRPSIPAEKPKLPQAAPPVTANAEPSPRTPVTPSPTQIPKAHETQRVEPTKPKEAVIKPRPMKAIPPSEHPTLQRPQMASDIQSHRHPSSVNTMPRQHSQDGDLYHHRQKEKDVPHSSPIGSLSHSRPQNPPVMSQQPKTMQHSRPIVPQSSPAQISSKPPHPQVANQLSHQQSHPPPSNMRPQPPVQRSQSNPASSSRPYPSPSRPQPPAPPGPSPAESRPEPRSHPPVSRSGPTNLQRHHVPPQASSRPQASQPPHSSSARPPPRTNPQMSSSRPPVMSASTKSQASSRNSPRTSYPDYGGINAADRYSHSGANERGYDRPPLYSSHSTSDPPANHISSQHQNKNPSSGTSSIHSPTMPGIGLHWGAGGSTEQRQHTEQRKSSLQGRSSLPSSTISPLEARSKQRLKQTPSAGTPPSRMTGRHSMAQYPAEYMGYPFSAHHSPSPHDFSAQQNGLLSAATNPSLLHTDLTASATLRVLQQQQQHKPTDLPSHASSMFLQAGHYPAAAAAHSQADQYNRLATAAAAQQHQLNMYHQAPNAAQNPWLQLHPSQMDPVYQLMQQHGQYPTMYHNILHKY